jgi:prevent-host-death family protein
MTQVGKREFALHTSKYLNHVEKTGQELLITDRKKPVLRIVPVEEKTFASLKGLLTKIQFKEDVNAPAFPPIDQW